MSSALHACAAEPVALHTPRSRSEAKRRKPIGICGSGSEPILALQSLRKGGALMLRHALKSIPVPVTTFWL
eukprot:6420574-Alexandrium_andersonii.AAC.1